MPHFNKEIQVFFLSRSLRMLPSDLTGGRVNPSRKTRHSKEVAKGSCVDLLTERKEANKKRACGSPSRWALITFLTFYARTFTTAGVD